MADLLVETGEQEDFHSFFAPQNREQRLTFRLFHRPKKVTFWDMSSARREDLWAGRADGLRAVFLLLACCYQEARGAISEALPTLVLTGCRVITSIRPCLT